MVAYVQRPGQSRDDIVRRSAGTPCAFVALFAAEPTGHPKTLLRIGKQCLDQPKMCAALLAHPVPLLPSLQQNLLDTRKAYFDMVSNGLNLQRNRLFDTSVLAHHVPLSLPLPQNLQDTLNPSFRSVSNALKCCFYQNSAGTQHAVVALFAADLTEQLKIILCIGQLCLALTFNILL